MAEDANILKHGARRHLAQDAEDMMATYVLVHGAWHTGEMLASVAQHIAAAGHQVHTPTIAGNRPADPADTSLETAIASIATFVEEQQLTDFILVGHSFGGMVITGVADRQPSGTIRRLVYWNAFVPNDGESLNDLVPGYFLQMFDEMALESGTVMMPFPIWRDALCNDMSAPAAADTYARLVSQPYRTFTDKIALSRPPAAFDMSKSYINFTEDTGMPHSMPWHPRLSEKLGLFRLVQASGGHEVCFSNPKQAAEAILLAGQD